MYAWCVGEMNHHGKRPSLSLKGCYRLGHVEATYCWGSSWQIANNHGTDGSPHGGGMFDGLD